MKKAERKEFAMTLVVLAGGKSRRMGRDKASLPLGSATLLEATIRPLEGMFDDILIAVSAGQILPAGPWRTAEDDVSGQGPLRGILTGLRNARHSSAFVLACDMPGLSPAVVRKLIASSRGADIAIAAQADALKEPLLGVYKKSVLRDIERLLENGERSILKLFDRVKVREVKLDGRVLPANVNTPAEYKDIQKKG